MFTGDCYLPTRIVFGAGRLQELASLDLPGKKALILVTEDQLMKKLGIQDKIVSLLKKNGVDYFVYDQVTPNPMKKTVMEAKEIALDNDCDFVIGLGGGSSIDVAKATAIMMVNPGDLWDYAYTGTGGQKDVTEAAPIVTISTTCGTGTESDPFCVITNEETAEKLDFAVDAIFPKISLIDPELMLSLPKELTVFQGLDGLFHAAECYVSNGHRNKFVDMYAKESVKIIAENLPRVVDEPDNLAARTELAFATNILSGYTMALVDVTSHHILAQSLGGLFPNFPHGASLIIVCEAYYSKVCSFLPEEFDELGQIMGFVRDPQRPGFAFVEALVNLMEKTDCHYLSMSDYGVKRKDFSNIVNMTVDQVGIGLDRYTLTKEDMMQILEESYR